MARIFISHSSRDRKVAEETMAWLKTLGFDNAFLDIDEQTGIQAGDKWEARLYEELAACSAVLLLVTPDWLASKWCFAEFVQARASGKAIFTIVLTPDGGRTFASDIQRVDFTTDVEEGRRRLARSLTGLALDVQTGFAWEPRRAPYPGLPAFERDDAAVYFGRDVEVRALIDRLRARRTLGGPHFIAVLGASGSGKSSLVRAGVLPRIEKFESDFVVVPPFRPGADPCTELAKALAEAAGDPAGWKVLRDALLQDPQGLVDVKDRALLAARRREGTLVVTIDQAEELFTVTSAAARAQLEPWLQVMAKLPVLVLLTLRSDHLGELQRWAQAIGAFEQFSLPPLPLTRLPEVIEGPARVAGVGIGAGLVQAVMQDAGGPDAMPLLAFTLRELWSQATADAGTDGPVIRLADYRALGDSALGLNPLENAVRRRADELVAEFDDTQRQRLRDAFVGTLVRIDDQGVFARRAGDWAEFDEVVRGLLQRFVGARLLVLRNDAPDGRSRVEVAHESLLRKWPLLKGWLDEERGFLLGRLQLQRALDDWHGAAPAERDSALMQGLLLARAREWLVHKAPALTAEQRSFIEASAAADDTRAQAARRRRLGVLGGAIAAGLALTVLAMVWWQSRQAGELLALEIETDRWLQRSAAALAYGQPDRALAQAQQAHALRPSAKTRSAVWQAGVAVSPALVFSVPQVDAQGELPAPAVGAVSALAWSPAADALVVGDRAGMLYALRTEGTRQPAAIAADRRQPADKNLPEAVLALRVAADGSRMAVLEDGRILRQGPGVAGFVVLHQASPWVSAAVDEAGAVVIALDAERRLRRVDCSPAGACRERDALAGLGADVAAYALEARSGQVAAAAVSGRLLVGSAGAPARELALPAGARVLALALEPRGDRLALTTTAGELLVLDAQGQVQSRAPLAPGAGRQLAWAPDGERIAMACETESLCIWRNDTGVGWALHTVLAVRGGGPGALAWSPDGRRLAAGDVAGRLHAWDLAAPPERAAVLYGAGAAIADVDVHPDGRRIVGADVRGQALVWDLPAQRLVQSLAHPMAGETRSVRFHPVQPQLALATLGGGVSLFAFEGGREIGRVEGVVEVLRWEPVQGRLLTAGQDGVARSHAIEAGQSLDLPEPHADAVIALAVAPAGSAAAAAPPAVYSADTRGVIKARGPGENGTVATATGTSGKAFSVDSLAFAPDGRRWLAAGNHGGVLVFDRTTRQIVQRLDTGADQINSAAWSPDGRSVAALDNAGRLHLWQGAPLERRATLWLRNEPGRVGNDVFGLVGQLRRLAWLPDSRRVAIATQSGSVLVLAVDAEPWLPPSR